MKLDKVDMTVLELMVDRSSVSEVVELLSRICSEKAFHVATNWQDTTTAKDWARQAGLLDNLSVKLGG